MSDGKMTDPRLLEAFELMWGTYPGPASLVHRSRVIAAANEACRRGGRQPGMKCTEWGPPERHRGCLANRALAEGKPFFRESRGSDGIVRVYWLPVPGYPDYYIHFTTEPVSAPDPS